MTDNALLYIFIEPHTMCSLFCVCVVPFLLPTPRLFLWNGVLEAEKPISTAEEAEAMMRCAQMKIKKIKGKASTHLPSPQHSKPRKTRVTDYVGRRKALKISKLFRYTRFTAHKFDEY